jgi:hypothetical protein
VYVVCLAVDNCSSHSNSAAVQSVIVRTQWRYASALIVVAAVLCAVHIRYTHTFALEDVHRAFEMASSYTDGVIKMIFEFPPSP